MLQTDSFVKNLLVLDEFLPAIMHSTNDSGMTPTREATKRTFADMTPLRALAFEVCG